MTLDQLTVVHAALALFLTCCSTVAVVLAAAKYIAQPRIEAMVRGIVAAEFTEREKHTKPLHDAEARALAQMLDRLEGVEARMGRLEEANTKAESAVERIERQGARQTKILEAITEQIAGIAVMSARMDERQKGMQERIDEMQQRPARRRS